MIDRSSKDPKRSMNLHRDYEGAIWRFCFYLSLRAFVVFDNDKRELFVNGELYSWKGYPLGTTCEIIFNL